VKAGQPLLGSRCTHPALGCYHLGRWYTYSNDGKGGLLRIRVGRFTFRRYPLRYIINAGYHSLAINRRHREDT
jgi:hypothetical protein